MYERDPAIKIKFIAFCIEMSSLARTHTYIHTYDYPTKNYDSLSTLIDGKDSI